MFISALPATGLAGWSFLKRTGDSELARLNAGASASRTRDYAEKALASVTSADDLLSDRKLLEVVLTAHGLEDRINDRAFLKQVLEQGATGDGSLANRLADRKLINLAATFNFDKEQGGLTSQAIDGLLDDYSQARHAEAVSEKDQTLASALRARSAFEDLSREGLTDKSTWYRIAGDEDMRGAIQTMLQLPSSIWALDIDEQVERMASAFHRGFGEEISAIADSGFRDRMLDRFVALSSIDTTTTMSSASIALSLFTSQGSIDLSL